MKKRLVSFFTSLLMVFSLVVVMPGVNVKAAGTIYWPVPGHTQLSQGWHNGNAIDISDGTIGGADVIAACGGTVCTIYLCPDQHYPNEGDCHGFGTGLVINGDDGRVYQYAHMQANSIPSNVYYGAYVSAGQKIGKVGTTGNSTGNHLHFGISYGKYWYNSGINPQNEIYNYTSPHTHSYSNSVTKQPTCTATGVRTYTCSCGSSYTETIAAKGHTYVNKVVAPTSTEKGYTLHTCSVCGNSYKDNYVNPPELKDDGWYYCDTLPSDVSSDKYTIQYDNYYEKTQSTSPGSDWTNAGVVKSEWQNSGAQYTSGYDLETSDSRVLISSIYYHFCGPNAGDVGNYEQSGNFVHYDWISASRVTSKYIADDNGHPYYLCYWSDGSQVYCKSGDTCDGAWGTHGARCRAWYKENTYQDRVKIVLNKYTKNSGWVSSKDSGAQSVKIRYKAKECSHTFSEWTETAAPTCTNEGTQTRECTVCGKTETQTVPAKGHTYTETIVEPTESAQGYTLHTCSACGNSYKDNYTDYVPEVTTEPTIKAESKTAVNGDTVTVNVSLENNPGFSYLKLGIVYDPSAMEFVEASNGAVSTDAFVQTKKALQWDSEGDSTEDGILVTLTFKVLENAAPGKYSVGVSYIACYNYDENDVDLKTVNGTVTVSDFVYGDVNGDGEINGKDIIRLRKYLAVYDESTGESDTEVSPGADANGDGTVNGKDLIRLRKYLAEYDEETGQSPVALGK